MGRLPGGKTLAELAGLGPPTASAANGVASDGAAGEAAPPARASLYRGRPLDQATSAAAKMLREGSVDVRFGISGDEEEVAELVNAKWGARTITDGDVASWIMRRGGGSGVGASCLVLERDDVLLGAAKLSGLNSGRGIVTVDFFVTPLDNLGKRFAARAARICAGWGCHTMQVRLKKENVPTRVFLEGLGFAVIEDGGQDSQDFVMLELLSPPRPQVG